MKGVDCITGHAKFRIVCLDNDVLNMALEVIHNARCKAMCMVLPPDSVTQVVYHLPKNSGNSGWDVNGKTILVCPNGNFPK